MNHTESRAAILEWLKKGEHLPVKKIHFERVSFDNGDFSYEFGQHPIGFIAIYENNFEHRADARRFSEFIASSRNITEYVQAYMDFMEKRVAELTEALKLAQEGLELAHSCGLSPYDVSGRQMWLDSAEIRYKTRKFISELEKE